MRLVWSWATLSIVSVSVIRTMWESGARRAVMVAKAADEQASGSPIKAPPSLAARMGPDSVRWCDEPGRCAGAAERFPEGECRAVLLTVDR